MTTSPSAQEKAQQTAATAADESKQVAGTAKQEAQNVAAEAKTQVSSLLDDAAREVSDQSRTQRDRLVGTLHSVSNDLEQMASQSGGSGLAADLVRQVSQRTRTLGDHVDGREPAELLDDVRAYARRRPGTFLLGALAAGVVAGRLTRGAKAAKDGSSSTAGLPATGTTMPPAAYVGGSPVSPVPASTAPTYSAPGVTTPGETVTGIPSSGDPLTDPLADPLADPTVEGTSGDLWGRDPR
jgi:Rod binding domain-containing protein